MKILQLCVFTDLWLGDHEITSIDLKLGSDIFDLDLQTPGQFDLVAASPPCDQFTKANAHSWEIYPIKYIEIAERCLELCKNTGKYWFLENPAGRIEYFIPELTRYRVLTWRDYTTNKEYILYANFIITQPNIIRYTKQSIPRSKVLREAWRPELLLDISHSINN